MKVDWVVVGAGLSGATLAERIASELGENVLLVEQRNHIAGNAYDEYNEHGVLEHKYGPHIFHTNSKPVWDYLSKFTAWRPYFHRVLASVDGALVPVPFNLNSLERLFPPELARRLEGKLIEFYGFGARVPILKMLEADDDDLRFLAKFVYKKIFENYTKKQWGLRPEELSSSVTARVPVLVSRDDRYFQDEYQAMPVLGYSAMVRNMLNHPRIRLMLNTRWQEIRSQIDCRRLVFTGAIDDYFDYKHGELPYRSLRFDFVTTQKARRQPVGTVNFPNEYDYTRVTELTHLTGQDLRCSTLLYEFSQPHVRGKTIPYYPVPTDENRELYNRYRSELRDGTSEVVLAGRLADYMYYNMDQAVASALAKFKEIHVKARG